MTLPIQDLEPDFYIAIDYDVNQPTSKDIANFKKIINLLYDKGFTCQLRSGNLHQLLIFIKLSSYKFSEEAEKDLIKNYELGVTHKDDVLASKLRIIHNYLVNSSKTGSCGINRNLKEWSFITDIVPITHSFKESTFVEDLKINVFQPNLSTNAIKATHGIQIALYFEFIKHYIFWLLLLSIVGLFSHFGKKNQRFSLTYAFINLVWGIFFLTSWRKREQHLVNVWGVQNCHLIEDHNLELAEINEKYEPKSTYFHSNNSDGIRFVKQLAFIPIALGFTAVLVSYQLACFCIEIFLTDIYNGPGKSLLTLLPTILISVFVPILTIIYNLVCGVVINWENHDNEYSKNNSILVKTFVLNFLTGYVPLIITSFIYLPFAHLVQPHLGEIKSTISSYVGENRFYSKYLLQLKSQEDFKINQGRLDAQFFYFIVTNQVIQLILKYVLPLGIRFVTNIVETKIQKKPQLDTEKDNSDEAVWLHNVRLSLKLPEYNVDDDFRGLVLQFGYLIIFGPVWPLAPIVCVIFNLIFFKLDNLKLINGKYFKPSLPKRVDSIHPWNWALFLLAWIGSIISPVVTAFYRHGTAPPKTLGQFAFDKASVHVSSSVYLVLLMFASEHGFLILSYIFHKFTSLFKSQVEWENDFIDNDIKLRHDYYSGKVKPTFKVHDDQPWDSFTIDSVLKFADHKGTGTTEFETVGSTSKEGYSTSAEKSSTTATSRVDKSKVISEKETVLKEKEAELEELEKKQQKLNDFKDPTDTIITSKNDTEGKPVLSTIDNNTHVTDVDEKERLLSAAAAAAGVSGSTADDDEASNTLDPKKIGQDDVLNSNVEGTSSPARSSSIRDGLKGGAHKVNALASSTVHSIDGGAHKVGKIGSNAIHKIDDSADYKKFVQDAEKEVRKSKSGIKKLFNKK